MTQGFRTILCNGEKGALIHHAFAIRGERQGTLRKLIEFFRTALDFDVQGNPDYFFLEADMLVIDDSREIKEAQMRKAFGERKIIVLAFNGANANAQNALLKVLEEPVSDTSFFIVIPHSGVLIPTVLSRVYLIEELREEENPAAARAEEFLLAPLYKRMTIARSLAESISEGDIDKQFALDFVGHLETLFYRRRKEKEIEASVLEDLSLARKYLGDTSASVKMQIEHLALVIPYSPR